MKSVVIACVVVLASGGARAQETETETNSEAEAEAEAETEAEAEMRTGDVVVSAEAEEVFRAGGSVHAVGEDELRELGYDDPNSVLTRVPGVYARSEEGFGLRPNIGMRGASAERSRKITLMEDGVLLAPAPYAAPAAYYFPMMARMTGVEVFAGPAAILFGPNTVGGAIDLRSRAIPTERAAYLDLAGGNTWYGRAHGYYGDANDWGGFLVEAIHVRSNGFHTIDRHQDADTGFHRTEALARGEVHGALGDAFFHRLELAGGFGLEASNETYLGTTDADYRADPHRRYASTELDRMEWWRSRVHLVYELEGDALRVRVVGYRHDFDRTWYRLDHFCDTLVDAPPGQRDTCNARVGFDRVLRSPDVYASEYGRLTGAIEPMPGDAPLLVARNGRRFAVHGVQADATLTAATGVLAHRVQAGVRLHYDEVRRDHTGDTYQLQGGEMVRQREGLELERNFDQAWALAAYASWGVTFDALTLSPGLRTELVSTKHADEHTGEVIEGDQVAVLPGIGAQLAVTPRLAAFAGVHLGYAPVAPGSGPEVDAEVAWNYEVGARYGRIVDPTHGQMTFFVSDYENLSSTCTLATGCGAAMLDTQSNAGAVLIAGLELEGGHELKAGEVVVPISATYTWTWSRFLTSFESPNPQLGSVAIGDRLPYVPEHQLSLRVGLRWRRAQAFVNGAYTSAMRDVAGLGEAPDEELTDPSFTLDARVAYAVMSSLSIYVRGENLTGAQPILTRRAWGARGSRPTLIQLGAEWTLD